MRMFGGYLGRVPRALLVFFLCGTVTQALAQVAEGQPPVKLQKRTETIIDRQIIPAYQQSDRLALLKALTKATRPLKPCLLYTSPSPRDATLSRMPSSA